MLGAALFTIDNDGRLFHNYLRTGERKQIGGPDFVNTLFMFAGNGQLYTIEKDGTLYHVNPEDGSWDGYEGDWKETKVGTIFENRLFTIEKKGALFGTDLKSGKWVPIGKPVHAGTAFLFPGNDALYTIDGKEGNLHRVNAKDGSRQQVGQPGSWKGTVAGTTLGGALYTVDANGALIKTNLADGTLTQVGKADFGSTTFLFGHAEKLFAIEKDGNLYRVTVKEGAR